MSNRELPPRRRGGRLKPIPPSYIYAKKEAEIPEAASVILTLDKGEAPVPPPPEFEHIMRELVDSGEWHVAESQYKLVNVEAAKGFIRDRWRPHGLTDQSVIEFDGEGSNGILIRSTGLFLRLPPDKMNLYGLGPHFQTIVDFSAPFRGKNGGGIIYSPISTPVPYMKNAWQSQNRQEQIIDTLISTKSRTSIKDEATIYIDRPNNPTGEAAPFESIRRLADFCADNGYYLIISEAFGDALPDNESAIPLTSTHPGIMVTRSVSKMLGLPGLRLGYTVLSNTSKDDIGAKYQALLKREPYHISGGQQLIANRIMDPNIIIPHLDNVSRPTAATLKRNFMNALDEAGIDYAPTDPRVPVTFLYGEKDTFHSYLLEQDLTSVEGQSFSITVEQQKRLDNSWVRVTEPPREEYIPEAVKRIAWAKRQAKSDVAPLLGSAAPTARTKRKPGQITR